ncbi:MAG: hypothetical protein O7G85_15095 [Planctomycetota bacterium]|nr:hypothetical protein [Planctomycetota bacterium]
MGESNREYVSQLIRVKLFRRLRALCLIVVLGGALMGYVSLFADSLTSRVMGHPTWTKDILGLLVGGVIGLISTLWLVPIFLGRNLRVALPIVYGITLLLVLSVTIFRNPFLAGVTGLVTLIILGIAIKLLLPRTIQRAVAGKCGWCGYDLFARESTRCPECGVDSDPDTIRLAPMSDGPVLGETKLRDYWMHSWRRRICMIVVCLLGIGLGASRYISPHFTPDRFFEVRNGMSQQEVWSVLGRPDRHSVDPLNSNVEVWMYEQGGMEMGYCIISFEDDVVTQSTIEGW